MARRTIQIDGDASGLKTAASAATQTIKTELDAQKKLVADAKAAQKALAADSTAAEKAAAKAAVQAASDGLEAKKRAYAEAAAAAKASAAAVRDAEREQAKSMAEMAQRARSEARRVQRNAQQRQDFGTPATPDAAGPPAIGLTKLLGSLTAGLAIVERFATRLTQLEEKLLDRTLTANETAGRRGEALRLAGVAGSSDLGARVGALAGNLSGSELTAALEQLATEGSGSMSGQKVEDILRVANRGAAGSALVAGSFGLRTADALTLAERYRLVTRGGSLGRDQASQIQALLSGGQLGGIEGVADYLAAAQATGTSLDGVNGASPFLNQSAALYRRYIDFRQRGSSRQASVSVLERMQNEAQGMAEAALATGDQSRATSALDRKIGRENGELTTMRDGTSAQIAGQTLFGDSATAQRLGVLPNQGRPLQVEIVNQPRQRTER